MGVLLTSQLQILFRTPGGPTIQTYDSNVLNAARGNDVMITFRERRSTKLKLSSMWQLPSCPDLPPSAIAINQKIRGFDRTFKAVDNIFSDAAGVQDRLLSHNGDVSVEPVMVVLVHGNAVQDHLDNRNK